MHFSVLYFFSSTVLPKYSFWNCWNSSSVNKDSGSLAFLAFLAGRSNLFLDCLPVLWLRIYSTWKKRIHIRYTIQERVCGFKQLKNETYTKQDTFCLFFYLHSVRLCCFAACFCKILKVNLHVALPLVLPKLLCVSTKKERKISTRRHSTCSKTS